MTNAVVAMEVYCGHAHEMIREALARVAAKHETAHELVIVEVDGIGGIRLNGDSLEYDPVAVLVVCLDELTHYVLTLFVQYHLRKMPLCNLMPDEPPRKKKHLH